jgi:hypothetical protein
MKKFTIQEIFNSKDCFEEPELKICTKDQNWLSSTYFKFVFEINHESGEVRQVWIISNSFNFEKDNIFSIIDELNENSFGYIFKFVYSTDFENVLEQETQFLEEIKNF